MEIRVPGSNVKSVSEAYQTEKAKTAKNNGARAGAGAAADSVAVSPDAKETQQIARAAEARAKELPDVREQLVESLQEQVQSGRYRVNPEKVARRILAYLLNRE
jgi:flagellar biosynthesis anti-sigma factor FlgM